MRLTHSIASTDSVEQDIQAATHISPTNPAPGNFDMGASYQLHVEISQGLERMGVCV